MKKTKLLTSTLLAVLVLTSLTAFPVFAATIPTFTLSASASQLQYVLPAGTTFNGSISTTGTVRFWINDPNGYQIVNLGLIDEAATFSFVAQQNGTYRLNFENDLPSSIEVSFSYVTNPDISGGDSSGLSLGYLWIPIVITVVGSILIFFIIRRKSKKQTYDSYKTAPSNPQTQ